MKLRSVVWVALVAIALGGTSIVGLANPIVGAPDDVPYFSDSLGNPQTFFTIGENVYVSYFDTVRDYNNSTGTPDAMYVAVNSQSTETCGAWVVGSGTVVDGPDPLLIPGDDVTDTLSVCAAGSGCSGHAQLALNEVDLAGNPDNDSGLFVGDVGNTPVSTQPGDHVVVGLTANNQDDAWIEIEMTAAGTGIMWYDSIANVDPGTRGYSALGAFVAAPGPGDGLYAPGDEMVWEVTDYNVCPPGYGAGVWYYRVLDSALVDKTGWQGFTPNDHGGTYPVRKIGFTPPALGTPTAGDTVQYLYDPTAVGLPAATPLFGDVLVDQPVDLANATYTIPVPPVPQGAPDNTSTGFVDEYMTINTANANVAGNGWWIGVHGTPADPVYDTRFDTFPIKIDVFTGQTVIGGSTPVITPTATPGFEIHSNGTTLNNLSFTSGVGSGHFVVYHNTPTNVTVQNCAFNTVGAATMAIDTGAGGSNTLIIDNNSFTTEGGDNAVVATSSNTGGGNTNLAITNNTFNRIGTTAGGGFAVQGDWWVNATVDNNSISGFMSGGIVVYAHDAGGGYSGATNGVTITRNTINNSGQAVTLWDLGTLGGITNVTIEGNQLTNGTYGLRVRDSQSLVDTANIQVLYNQITGNTTLGVSNEDGDATVLDAELNWWGGTPLFAGPPASGSPGPTHAAGNANGDGDGSSNNVGYRPWLNGIPFCGSAPAPGITLADNYPGGPKGNKTVEANSWYWTINQALAAQDAVPCPPGGPPCGYSITIDVWPGTYAEEIVFGYGNIGTTTLRSTGGKGVTNIEAGADTTIIEVLNGYQNLTIGVAVATPTAPRGFTIYFDAAAVTFPPTSDKIDFRGSDLQIYDCDVLGTTGTGIYVFSASAGGRIERTLVDDCDTSGIWLEVVGGGTPAFVINDCTITNGGDGITVDSGANTITNCLIQFNTFHGIDLSSNGNTVGGSGNIIRNNAQNGLLITAQGNTVSGNTIHNNGDRGIDITGNNNTFNNNQITSNAAQGVRLGAASTGNVFNFDNTLPAPFKSAANTNCIYDNDSDGSNNNEQMRNLNTATDVDATHNYWGSAAGPFNAMRNASGDMNNRVTDFVLIVPFAQTCGGGTADATTSLSCGAGWYLTSVPLVPGDPIAENVYNALPVFAAYQWDPAQVAYDNLAVLNEWPADVDDNVAWSDGYWLWLMGNETITVYGGEVTTNQTITLGATGWQQFSVPSVDIPVQPAMLGGTYPVPAGAPNIEFWDGVTLVGGLPDWKTYVDAYLAGWIAEGIYRWDPCAGTEGAYVMMSQQNAVLDPWFGYWIETLVPGVQVQIPVAYWVTNPWTFPTRYLPAPQAISATNGRTPPPPPPTPAAFVAAIDPATGIAVINEPNPVRDVNTTTFRVMAIDPVEAILVQIFDQAGVLVFEETQAGDELVWHTDNDYGEFLANGVYLYRVSALINGRWVVTGVRKLAIFR